MARERVSYLKRYLRGLDTERLMKVLRFLTGAKIICVDRIKVTFTFLHGLDLSLDFPVDRNDMDSELGEMDVT